MISTAPRCFPFSFHCSNISLFLPPWDSIRLSNVGPERRVDACGAGLSMRKQPGGLLRAGEGSAFKGGLYLTAPQIPQTPQKKKKKKRDSPPSAPRRPVPSATHTFSSRSLSPSGTNHLAPALMGLGLAAALPSLLPPLSSPPFTSPSSSLSPHFQESNTSGT